MPNTYVNFLKYYQNKHKITYGEAMKKGGAVYKSLSDSDKAKYNSPAISGGGLVNKKDRQKKIKEYKKLLPIIEAEIKSGNIDSVKIDKFIKIAVDLAGAGSHNQYAKAKRRIEKLAKSKKYQPKKESARQQKLKDIRERQMDNELRDTTKKTSKQLEQIIRKRIADKIKYKKAEVKEGKLSDEEFIKFLQKVKPETEQEEEKKSRGFKTSVQIPTPVSQMSAGDKDYLKSLQIYFLGNTSNIQRHDFVLREMGGKNLTDYKLNRFIIQLERFNERINTKESAEAVAIAKHMRDNKEERNKEIRSEQDTVDKFFKQVSKLSAFPALYAGNDAFHGNPVQEKIVLMKFIAIINSEMEVSNETFAKSKKSALKYFKDLLKDEKDKYDIKLDGETHRNIPREVIDIVIPRMNSFTESQLPAEQEKIVLMKFIAIINSEMEVSNETFAKSKKSALKYFKDLLEDERDKYDIKLAGETHKNIPREVIEIVIPRMNSFTESQLSTSSPAGSPKPDPAHQALDEFLKHIEDNAPSRLEYLEEAVDQLKSIVKNHSDGIELRIGTSSYSFSTAYITAKLGTYEQLLKKHKDDNPASGGPAMGPSPGSRSGSSSPRSPTIQGNAMDNPTVVKDVPKSFQLTGLTVGTINKLFVKWDSIMDNAILASYDKTGKRGDAIDAGVLAIEELVGARYTWDGKGIIVNKAMVDKYLDLKSIPTKQDIIDKSLKTPAKVPKSSAKLQVRPTQSFNQTTTEWYEARGESGTQVRLKSADELEWLTDIAMNNYKDLNKSLGGKQRLTYDALLSSADPTVTGDSPFDGAWGDVFREYIEIITFGKDAPEGKTINISDAGVVKYVDLATAHPNEKTFRSFIHRELVKEIDSGKDFDEARGEANAIIDSMISPGGGNVNYTDSFGNPQSVNETQMNKVKSDLDKASDPDDFKGGGFADELNKGIKKVSSVNNIKNNLQKLHKGGNSKLDTARILFDIVKDIDDLSDGAVKKKLLHTVKHIAHKVTGGGLGCSKCSKKEDGNYRPLENEHHDSPYQLQLVEDNPNYAPAPQIPSIKISDYDEEGAGFGSMIAKHIVGESAVKKLDAVNKIRANITKLTLGNTTPWEKAKILWETLSAVDDLADGIVKKKLKEQLMKIKDKVLRRTPDEDTSPPSTPSEPAQGTSSFLRHLF
jgi:hypothetical protein